MQEFIRVPNGEVLCLQIVVQDARFAERVGVLFGAVLTERDLANAHLEAVLPCLGTGLHHLLNAGSIRSAYFRAVCIRQKDEFSGFAAQDFELVVRPVGAE